MYKIEELYHLYFKDVYLYLLALSRNDDIAEEITQETFFKALKALDKFQGRCDIRVWLCQIAKNSYYTYYTKNKHIDGKEIDERLPDERIHLENDCVNREQAKIANEILNNMEDPYKEVFQLRVFAELSYKDIGKLFGKTESWGRVTFHRAKLKIIKEMEKHGYEQ